MQLRIFGTHWPTRMENYELVLPDVEVYHGEISKTELILIAYIVKRFEPEYMFEIGTFRGRTTSTMALNANGRLKKVYTLDLDMVPDYLNDADKIYCHPDKVGTVFRNGMEKKVSQRLEYIEQLWGDSREFDFSPYYKKMDLVFVDGGHDYQTECSDITNALMMVKDDGIVLIHDFAMWRPEVINAVDTVAQAFDVYVFQDTTLAGIGKRLEGFYAEN